MLICEAWWGRAAEAQTCLETSVGPVPASGADVVGYRDGGAGGGQVGPAGRWNWARRAALCDLRGHGLGDTETTEKVHLQSVCVKRQRAAPWLGLLQAEHGCLCSQQVSGQPGFSELHRRQRSHCQECEGFGSSVLPSWGPLKETDGC